MYQGRLRKWGVRKHMTREDKEKLLSGLTEDSKQEMAPSERRKLRRYKADKRKQKDVEKQAFDYQFRQLQNMPEAATNISSLPFTSTDQSSKVNFNANASEINQRARMPLGLAEHLTVQRKPQFKNNVPRNARFRGSGTPILRPSAPIPIEYRLRNDPNDCNLPWVLTFTQDIIRRHSVNSLSGESAVQRLAPKPSAAVERALAKINENIYLLKLRDWRKGEPLYFRLRTASWDSFLNLTPDFLRKFLAVTSPIKFTTYPEARQTILSHFLALARELWGDKHSFARLIRELQKDRPSLEVTEKALSCIEHLLIQEPSCAERKRPNLAFRTKTSIIALQRRSKALTTATQSASDLFARSEQTFGSKSLETRDAAEQLAHAFMDTGKLDEAQALCLQRVGPAVGADGWIGHGYGDERAMRAMEDLAEIERKLGRFSNCMTWLQAAVYCAIDTKQPDIFVLHIVDKFMEAARACGQTAEALLWRAAFTRDVWKKPENLWTEIKAGKLCESIGPDVWSCNRIGWYAMR
ncbi:MAG: hypothetical protein Q9160_005059 [Pyrenula sp. 1 TL-2023]